jgi:hypothetical protein
MNSGDAQNRNLKAAEYLQLLGSLAVELEKAMNAIAQNALPDLEESIVNQQALSSRLTVLVNQICVPLKTETPASKPGLDEEMIGQIHTASNSLQQLNRRYAALLQHSSRSVAQMVELFNSVRGQIQEASGPRLKVQTWSCQM